MTRVLLLGNLKSPHSTENEWRLAFEANDVELTLVQEGFEKKGRAIAGIAKSERVDFVVWVHTHPLWPDGEHPEQRRLLAALRKAKTPCIGLHLDRWMGLDREHQVRDEPYFEQSLVCTADGGHDEEFAELGVNHVWFPPAVSHVDALRDVNTSSRMLRSKKVGFVGSWTNYHEEWPWRYNLVLWLRRNYQSHLALYPVYGRSVRGKDLNVIYTSVPVIVGDSCLAPKSRMLIDEERPMTHYSSDRIPETLGRGGFLLHPRVEGVTDGLWQEGEHLACYDVGDFDDLKSQIEYWNENVEERQRIAKAGREWTIEHHTYRVRVKRLLEMVRDGVADWR